MSSEPSVGNIRLAMRVEGGLWVAYAAQLTTMEGAVMLGSITMDAVITNVQRKNAFMDMMKGVLCDYIQDATGGDPTWDAPTRAPEHERAGRA